jgi:hypothetical protein
MRVCARAAGARGVGRSAHDREAHVGPAGYRGSRADPHGPTVAQRV